VDVCGVQVLPQGVAAGYDAAHKVIASQQAAAGQVGSAAMGNKASPAGPSGALAAETGPSSGGAAAEVAPLAEAAALV
jgi:hypothetical protein